MSEPAGVRLQELADCGCCGLPRLRRRERHADDQRVERCAECWAHADSALQKEAEHKRWWREALNAREAEAAHARSAAVLAEQRAEASRRAIDDLRRSMSEEVRFSPDHPLLTYLINDEVHEARQKVEAAYRRRDSPMRTAWHLEELHHEDSAGVCSCGRKSAQCREFTILIPVLDDLRKWEAGERDRMLDGLPHGLPWEHPDAVRYHGDWKGPRSLQSQTTSAESLRRFPSDGRR